jgi:heparan-alpha-glucosaminide N-acetyltransferase
LHIQFPMNQVIRRQASIDVFRALTMFLMIFVNDFGTLADVPAWLEHAAKEEDRMGLADAVFPAFLFIVGLSIPLAIRGRIRKGGSPSDNFVYIFTRSFALLVMGVFQVNLESYDSAAALLPKPVWQIGITLCFFLIWLDYSPRLARVKKWLLQGSGVVLLLVLGFLFKGGGLNEDGVPLSTSGLHPLWYGILGLIGWSYLLCACVYLFAKERMPILIAAFFFLMVFSIADKEKWLYFMDPIRSHLWIVSSGALPAITMAGVISSVIHLNMTESGKRSQGMLVLGFLSLVLLAAGFALRPYWNISKIRTNPPWVLICTSISMACFVGMIYLMDIRGQDSRLRWLKPAGTSTLTSYLLPYIHYALLALLGAGFSLPMVLRTGNIGIVKSLLYAGLIVYITGVLEKRRIRLSI